MLQCQLPGASFADGRSKINDPVFFEVSRWENRILTLDDLRAFAIFQALTILAAGGHLFGGAAFQVDALGRFHLAKCVGSQRRQLLDLTGRAVICQFPCRSRFHASHFSFDGPVTHGFLAEAELAELGAESRRRFVVGLDRSERDVSRPGRAYFSGCSLSRSSAR